MPVFLQVPPVWNKSWQQVLQEHSPPVGAPCTQIGEQAVKWLLDSIFVVLWRMIDVPAKAIAERRIWILFMTNFL